MSNIIKWPDLKRLEVLRKPKDPCRYFCTVCNRDLFKIQETGVIYCFNCGLPITNLEAREK